MWKRIIWDIDWLYEGAHDKQSSRKCSFYYWGIDVKYLRKSTFM